MLTRRIGGLEVSVVGLGCNQLGTTCDEPATRAIVEAALACGITCFDTADEYGDGASETVLGRVLRDCRDDVVIATKFGSPYGFEPGRRGASARWIVTAVEDSLRRLATDRIDLYQLHFPDPDVPIAETLEALDQLVASGKVREIGCSNFTAEQVDEAAGASTALGVRAFASVQHRLNLLRQENLREVMPAARRHGMAFIPYFPLASGVLTGKYQRGAPPAPGTRLGDHVEPDVAAKILSDATLARVEALVALAAEHGHTLPELAIAWLIAQPSVVTVIAGATSPAQVRSNAAAAAWELDEETATRAGAIGAGR